MQLVLSQSGFSSSVTSDSLPQSTSLLLNSSGVTLADEDGSHPLFDQLFSETRQWIKSSDFTLVLEACLDRACDKFFEDMDHSVFVDSATELPGSGEMHRIRLAALLPGLSRWSESALTGLPNELVEVCLSPSVGIGIDRSQGVLDVPQVSIFQAIIWGKIDELA